MDAVTAFDQRLYLALAAAANPLTTTLGILLAAFGMLGLGWWIFAAAGVRAHGWTARGRSILFSALLGGVSAWLIGEGMKVIVKRPRPFLALQVPATIEPSSYSFPSGDTALAFGAGTAIALTWPAARLPAILLAIACGLGRMMVGAHYLSDVLAGAALGVACGYGAVAAHRRIVRAPAPRAVIRDPSAWFAVPDLLLASGEAIVRNLQEGLRRAAPATVDALDAPGHPAQLPQVLRGFGYESYVFSRGAPSAFDPEGGVMHWQGPSGDQVLARYVAGAAGEDIGTAFIAGELADGRYAPVGRNGVSARTSLRRRVRLCERLLLDRCEPLDALGGGTAGPELRALWQALLAEQSYEMWRGLDDAGADALSARLDALRERCTALAERLERAVGENVVPRRPGSIDALGDGVIQNDLLRVELAADGSFVVTDRATGERTGRQNVLADDGDRGDSFTFAHAGPDVGAAGLRGARETAATGDRATATARFTLQLPRALRADRLARSHELVPCAVVVTLSLEAGGRAVDVLVRIDNRARDHRLRALCETSQRTQTHRAGVAFAWIERPNRPPSGGGWTEPAVPENIAHDLVAVSTGGRGLAVGIDGPFEYAVLGDGATIALTLFRAVGWVSRDDLRERPGHLGGGIPIDAAQELGEVSTSYVVFPFVAGGVLPAPRRSALAGVGLDAAAGVALSALRAGTDGRLIVRLVNLDADTRIAAVVLPQPMAAARAVDLREGGDAGSALPRIRTAAPPEIANGRMRVTLQPGEIGTYEVTLA